MGTFLNQLKVLLAKTDSIDKDEVKAAILLIKQRRLELNLCNEGPCLACKVTTIYGHPSKIHISRGDDWLNSLFKKWKEPPIIERQGKRLGINNYGLATISPYFCEDCYGKLLGRLDDFEKQEEIGRAVEQKRGEEYEIALLLGKVKSTPAKRFWTMVRRVSVQDTERLRQLSYRLFLDTLYWDIIRKYILHKRGYRCELCSENGKLNVHHKSYDHRGEEHNYLEDLIVLCHPCHAKFHDKLEKQGV